MLLGDTLINSMKQQLFQVWSICQIKTESHRINSLSIRQNQAEFHTMEQFEYSLKPHTVSHNKAF